MEATQGEGDSLMTREQASKTLERIRAQLARTQQTLRRMPATFEKTVNRRQPIDEEIVALKILQRLWRVEIAMIENGFVCGRGSKERVYRRAFEELTKVRPAEPEVSS